MTKAIKLVPLEQKVLDKSSLKKGMCVQVYNTMLDNTEYENATILFLGEYVCVYTSDSCKERSAQLFDLLFKETEKQAAINHLVSQRKEITSFCITDETIERLIDMGYRQIVQ